MGSLLRLSVTKLPCRLLGICHGDGAVTTKTTTTDSLHGTRALAGYDDAADAFMSDVAADWLPAVGVPTRAVDDAVVVLAGLAVGAALLSLASAGTTVLNLSHRRQQPALPH